jgi:hypothetical protein
VGRKTFLHDKREQVQRERIEKDMAKSKLAEAVASPAKLLHGVKDGRVSKSSTEKVGKVGAEKAKKELARKAVESDDDDDSEGSSMDDSEDDSSEDDDGAEDKDDSDESSDDEDKKPAKKELTKTNGANGVHAKGVNGTSVSAKVIQNYLDLTLN